MQLMKRAKEGALEAALEAEAAGASAPEVPRSAK